MKIEDFREYAKSNNVIPVYRKLIADGETPVNIYKKLAQNKAGTFLLESAEHGGVWSRYSFIGAHSQTSLTEKDGAAVWIGKPPAGVPEGMDPLTALRLTVAHLKSPKIEGLPTLTGGLVGYMGYDAVRRLEKLPELAKKDISLPEITFMLTSDLAVMDHSDGTIILIANAINWDGSDQRIDESYYDAVARLDRMQNELLTPLAGDVAQIPARTKPEFDRNMTAEEFKAKIEIAKEDIRAGEAFQIVLSQRFSMSAEADALDIYRMLRLNNPSPYMYLFRFEDGYEVVGSSPEALVKVTGTEVMVHPIAGTRKRSSSIEEDVRLGEELLADPKERAEHLMLVDLGRNDLGRVCAPGSVEVIDFMHIERYSHVMHIVSTVIGKLAKNPLPSMRSSLSSRPAHFQVRLNLVQWRSSNLSSQLVALSMAAQLVTSTSQEILMPASQFVLRSFTKALPMFKPAQVSLPILIQNLKMKRHSIKLLLCWAQSLPQTN
jgi:anthranilate synthase component 1